ncbi:hypothetical protein pclt_cds_648 [Pandoravirus celtis]|uniref:Uncharacterized protein n=1 Tax=Pandoravirus celtis TaxID=2568002 RepID=A0A4D6EJ70_9VIRU|nr:hypothetical protein pclt_cds_648 [Pandoravirus celtis]
MQEPNKCGWFSAQHAQQDGYSNIWATPNGGQVAVTAVLECDGLRDPARQPEGEFRGPVTRWLRTEYAPGHKQAEPFPRTARYQSQPSYGGLVYYRPENESFGGTTQGSQPLGMMAYDAEGPMTSSTATRSELGALIRQREEQLDAARKALAQELERARAMAGVSAPVVPQQAVDLAAVRRLSRWEDFDASYGAGPGQQRTPRIRMDVPTEYDMYGEDVDPDFRLAARAVYALRRVTEALKAARRTGRVEGLGLSGIPRPNEQAAVAKRRVLLAFGDLLTAMTTPGADVDRARAIFNDALATAADVVGAIEEILIAYGFPVSP